MSIITQGGFPRDFDRWPVVDSAKIQSGSSVIFKFNGPPAVFKFIPESWLLATVKGWINARNQVGESQFILIGTRIETDTGDIYMYGHVKALNVTVLQAGVNPYAITAIIAGMFTAASLIGLTFVYAYQPSPGSVGGALVQDIKDGGLSLTKIADSVSRASWLTIGAFVGIGVITVYGLTRRD